MLRASLSLSCLTFLVAAQEAPPIPLARPLFDGASLAGWHGQGHLDPYKLAAMPDDERAKLRAADDATMQAHWRVENGELINDGEGAYLTSDELFGDVVFSLEYRTVTLADSGIYLRGCPQVQIWDYTEAGGKWKLGADKGSGGLWNNQVEARFPPLLADKPFGEWNRLVIAQVGERVWVTLNGVRTVDGVRMENYWDRKLAFPAVGPLQLQTHGGEIRFRNLTVRELGNAERMTLLAGDEDFSFTPLFDGETFAGWQGATDNYEIVAGAIRCKQGKGGNLFTKERYGDFQVRLCFRLPPGGNNGLAVRYPGEGDSSRTAVELQVLDDSAAQYATLKDYQYHGSVYGVVPAQRGYQRPVGEWNFQQVTCVGTHYKVELNGTVIVDADVAKLATHLDNHTGKDRIEGFFGFCGHNDPVEFKDVRIRRL